MAAAGEGLGEAGAVVTGDDGRMDAWGAGLATGAGEGLAATAGAVAGMVAASVAGRPSRRERRVVGWLSGLVEGACPEPVEGAPTAGCEAASPAGRVVWPHDTEAEIIHAVLTTQTIRIVFMIRLLGRSEIIHTIEAQSSSAHCHATQRRRDSENKSSGEYRITNREWRMSKDSGPV